MSDLTMQIILITITSFMNAFIIFNFMERIFVRIYHQKSLYSTLFIVAGLLLTTSNLTELLFVNLIVSVSVILAVGIGLYGANKSSDILIMFLFYMFLVLTEVIGQTIIAFIYTQPLSVSSGNITQSVITFSCYQITMVFIAKNKTVFNRTGNWITLVVIPVISLFLIYAITQILIEQSGSNGILFAAISCILVFAINIVVFTLFHRIATLNHQNEQLMLLENQKQLQYRHLQDLEQNYEDSRNLFHDIKNHLNMVEQLYQYEHSQAYEYADSLRDKIDSLGNYPPSSNRIINILTTGWISKANSNGIEFHCNFEDTNLSFITDIDLNTILTNLLDNAFDECIGNRQGNNFIDLSICQINNFVVFHISNSCETVPQKNGQHYISQKDNHMGLGLASARSTAEQYNGSMSVLYENHIFTVQITFSGRKADFPQT